jgi:hypothetical protein
MRFQVRNDKIDLADELEAEFVAVARQTLTEAGSIGHRHARRKIEQYGPAGPAPPGSTPATFTGNLSRLTKQLPTRVRGRVASSGVIYAPHAHLLEYGYTKKSGHRVLPRPFIAPAQEAAQPEVDALLRERF